jgi:hypothetical protein
MAEDVSDSISCSPEDFAGEFHYPDETPQWPACAREIGTASLRRIMMPSCLEVGYCVLGTFDD